MIDPTRTLLAVLRADGFTLSVRDGQLICSPGSKLTPAQAEAIRSHKEDLIAILGGHPTWAEMTDAIAARARDEPPDFGEGNVVLRESWLIEGMDGWVAVSPEFVKWLEDCKAVAQERALKEQHRKEKTKKSGKKPK